MIVAIYLRNIKTYRGINYIPLVEADNFCGLVGNNGIGKSSVLEALDAFFNEKPQNLNISTKKSGLPETDPQVLPIFLIKKSDISGKLIQLAERLDALARNITESDVNLSYKSHVKNFIMHRDSLKPSVFGDDSYLIPLGVNYLGKLTVSPFNCRRLVELHFGESADKAIKSLSIDHLEDYQLLLNRIKEMIEYIYIPKEMDSESFTKLETAEIQALMGETLNEIIEKIVTPGEINQINQSLKTFIDELSSELEEYSYRTPTDRQKNLKKQDIYNLIVHAFFGIRKLHKKQGDHWLEIGQLSSGEKQKAIIDVAHKLIKEHRVNGDNLIIAIDEPESSLHMSACFDQFSALHEISRNCRQLLFSTHWYGFFPTIETGSAAVISKKDGEHRVDLINLSSHREQVKQLAAISKGKLPYDIRLKSINDFVQSIITSSMSDEPFNWLICEGSSEKIYFSKYFEDLISDRRLRIVPVGGAKEIKRIYQHLAISYEEFKSDIKGKIILISDTDAELVSYETGNFQNLLCRRIVNIQAKRDTVLIPISANPVSPKTEIEDALNGRLFFETLLEFSKDFHDLIFIRDYEITGEGVSHFALDLRDSERQKILNFFDFGNNKFKFAERYVAAMNGEHKTPEWILGIREMLEAGQTSKLSKNG